MKTETQSKIDSLAIVGSVLCAAHCALLPIFLTSFPSLLSMPVEDHLFHQMLVFLVLPLSVIAVFFGWKRHKDTLVLVGAIVGLVILVGTAIFGHDLLGEIGEKVATFTATIILACIHWRNLKLCRQASCSQC